MEQKGSGNRERGVVGGKKRIVAAKKRGIEPGGMEKD